MVNDAEHIWACVAAEEMPGSGVPIWTLMADAFGARRGGEIGLEIVRQALAILPERAEGENELPELLLQLVTGHDNGAVRIESAPVDPYPDPDAQPWPWHEEWLHHVRKALQLDDQDRSAKSAAPDVPDAKSEVG